MANLACRSLKKRKRFGLCAGIVALACIVLGSPEVRAQALPVLKPLSAGDAQSLMSGQSGTPTSIKFVNNSGNPVIVSWIDYAGHLKRYATLAPQQIYVQPTFTTHPWLISDVATGQPLQTFLPIGQPAQANINAPAKALPASAPAQVPTEDFRKLEAAIDAGFVRWSGGWMMDRYIPVSAHVTGHKSVQGVDTAQGYFSFTRSGTPLTIPFAAAVESTNGGYQVDRLCYNDQSSGMRDCSDTYHVGQANPQALAALLLVAAVASDASSSGSHHESAPQSAPAPYCGLDDTSRCSQQDLVGIRAQEDRIAEEDRQEREQVAEQQRLERQADGDRVEQKIKETPDY